MPSLPPLLPAPRHASPRPGRLRLRDGLPVVLAPAEASDPDGDLDAALALRDAVRAACGVTLAVESHARTDGIGPHVALRREGDRGEGYTLRVERDGAEVVGSGPAGLRYGVETLGQLVDARGGVPCCHVDDAPELAWRGLMLDVSRGKVPTDETLRAVVDVCVRLKLNVLMLYTEHTFAFRRHPRIGEGTSPLDARALRALDAYAARRHVELVPCLQSLGHMERILALPEYTHLDESGRGWTLSPVDPGTYALLRDLYEEYLPNFRSRWLNANCDEPWDLARGRSAEREAELGPGGVYLEHVRRVRELAAAHGKRTMIWGDVVHAHPERVKELPRDLVLLDWWYEAELDYDRVRVFRENGIPFCVCPGTSSWNCLFPRVGVSERNVRGWAEAGRRHGALGLLMTDWGDNGHPNLLGSSWLGFAHAAQESWSGTLERRAFDRAFGRALFGDASGEAARLYRELGSVHDPGFVVPNASGLAFLYIDDLETSAFLAAAREPALARCERRLARAAERVEAARPRFARDPQTWKELHYAARASLVAVRRGRAALAYNAWRREPGAVRAAERRRLATRLRTLAEEQGALVREWRRLWLARNHRSEMDFTVRRMERAVRSLRRAARCLERGAPPRMPPPPADHRLSGPEPFVALAQEWRGRYRHGRV